MAQLIRTLVFLYQVQMVVYGGQSLLRHGQEMPLMKGNTAVFKVGQEYPPNIMYSMNYVYLFTH